MDQNKGNKCRYMPISVLELPPKNWLVAEPYPNPLYQLFQNGSKKNHVQQYHLSVQKTRLFNTLEIHEWRKKTQFPISKTLYVKIESAKPDDSQNVDLLVYIEHCPQRISQFKAFTVDQTLYCLKEAIVGFERLFNRFGAFKISDNMIGIDEKGQCKVWIHQNLASSTPFSPEINQQRMLAQLINIIESRSLGLLETISLFQRLRQTKTFLSAILQIQNFVTTLKMKIPHRFKTITLTLNISRLSPVKSLNQPDSPVKKIEGISGISLAGKTNYNPINKPISSSVHLQEERGQLKKIKSLNLLNIVSRMKNSDSETTNSINAKQIKVNSNSNLTLQKQQKAEQQSKKDTQTIQNCELSQDKNVKLLRNDSKMMISKYKSLSFQKNDEDLFQANRTKASQKRSANQFSLLCKQSIPRSDTFKIDNSISDQMACDEHTEAVIRNNGWKSFNGFLEETEQLNESFTEGQQENLYLKQFQLSKLQNLVKRSTVASVLPDQYEILD